MLFPNGDVINNVLRSNSGNTILYESSCSWEWKDISLLSRGMTTSEFKLVATDVVLSVDSDTSLSSGIISENWKVEHSLLV